MRGLKQLPHDTRWDNRDVRMLTQEQDMKNNTTWQTISCLSPAHLTRPCDPHHMVQSLGLCKHHQYKQQSQGLPLWANSRQTSWQNAYLAQLPNLPWVLCLCSGAGVMMYLNPLIQFGCYNYFFISTCLPLSWCLYVPTLSLHLPHVASYPLFRTIPNPCPYLDMMHHPLSPLGMPVLPHST